MSIISSDVAHRVSEPGEPLGRRPGAARGLVFARALYNVTAATPAVAPASGAISYNPASGAINVSYTASNGADMTTKLKAMQPGDTITINGVVLTISTVNPLTYASFTALPAVSIGPDGSYAVEFRGWP